MPRKTDRDIQVTGIVLPNDWDSRDQLVEVVLYGNDESEHVIAGRLAERLLGLSHYRVRAHGREYVHNGRRCLDVAGYEILGTGAVGYDPDSILNPAGRTG